MIKTQGILTQFPEALANTLSKLRGKRLSFYFSLIIACSVVAGPSQALEQKVFFQGMAYLGAAKHIDSNYPYSLSLNKRVERQPGRIDLHLRSLLSEKQAKHYKLLSGLANLNQGESLVAAVAVDREFVTQEPYQFRDGIKTRVIADVSLQVMLFDFESMSLLASEPIAMAMNDILPGDTRASEERIQKLFERLYFDKDGVLGLAVKALLALNPNQRDSRFQVKSVKSNAAVAAQIPGNYSDNQVEHYLGQFFTAELAKRYQISVLPFQRGYAIGKQMAGRFSNGNVFNLKLPLADYEFAIELNGVERSTEKDRNFYIAKLHFSLSEEHSGEFYIQDHFRNGVYKYKSAAEGELYHWSAYEDAYEELLGKIADQLYKPDRAWLKVHAKSKNSYRQFKKNKDLYDE